MFKPSHPPPWLLKGHICLKQHTTGNRGAKKPLQTSIHRHGWSQYRNNTSWKVCHLVRSATGPPDQTPADHQTQAQQTKHHGAPAKVIRWSS